MKLLFTLLFSFSFSFMVFGQANVLTNSNLPILSITTSPGFVLDRTTNIPGTYRLIVPPNGGTVTPSSTPQQQGTLGIRYRGKTSFDLSDKKPYTIEIQDAKGEDLDVSILGMPAESDWVLLAPFSDKSLIREAIVYRLGQKVMPWAPRYRFVNLVINGSYDGVYMLAERLKRNKNRINITKMSKADTIGDKLTGGYIWAFDKTDARDVTFKSQINLPGKTYAPDYVIFYPDDDEIVTKQRSYIRDWMRNFEAVMNGAQYNNLQTGYPKYIDINSFVDNVLINELSKNVDAYRLSTYFHKDADSKNPKMVAGPIWDYNLAFGNANYCQGALTTGWGYDFTTACPTDFWVIHFWWPKLINEPDFRFRIKRRWTELRKGMYSTTNMMKLVDTLTNTIGTPSITANFNRWPILSRNVWPNAFVGGSYDAEITYLKNWITQRLDWMDRAIAEIPDRVVSVKDPKVTDEGLGEISVYPNPATDQFNLEFRLFTTERPVDIEITDISGRKVYRQEQWFVSRGPKVLEVPSANWSPGVYFYRVSLGEKGTPLVGRMVKQ
jgi:spore coat protein CotH